MEKMKRKVFGPRHRKPAETAASRMDRDGTAPFSGPKALIYQSELELIARWVLDYRDLETGGDLFGFWTHSGFPVVQYVIGPGPCARRAWAAFYQDRDYLIESGSILRKTHGLQHIGEWHSHHSLSLAEPSGGDTNTVQRALEQHGIARFLLSICNIVGSRDEDLAEIRAFLFSRSAARGFANCAWVVLPSKSPIREALEREQKHVSHQPRSRQWAYVLGEETTLEAGPTDDVLIAPDLPPDSWLSTAEGQNQLREIHARLSREVENLQIFLSDDSYAALSFSSGPDDCEVHFPADFPNSEPAIYRRQRGSSTSRRVDPGRVFWQPEQDASAFILHVLSAAHAAETDEADERERF